jgi:hypothetical protein
VAERNDVNEHTFVRFCEYGDKIRLGGVSGVGQGSFFSSMINA